MCATARTLWGSLCSLKRGLFAFVAASSVLSAQRTSVCLCVCCRCSSRYSSWRSLITGVSLLSSRTDSMLQRYWLIGVNGISTLFRLAPWGLVSKPFFLFQVAALREAPLHWAYFSIPYPPLWNSPPVYSSAAGERGWSVRARVVQRGIMSSQLGPALINLPSVFRRAGLS